MVQLFFNFLMREYSVSPSHENAFKQLIKLCLEENSQLSLELFDLFLTPEEKEALSTRYLIIQALLQQKKSQREIAKELQVSIAKITRGSNELKRMKPSLIQYLRNYL